MMRTAAVTMVAAALMSCPPGPLEPDAGDLDGAPLDAGFDGGSQILARRDAGPLFDTGPAWLAVRDLMAIPPSDGGVTARWVTVSPPAIDQAWSGGVLLFDGGVVGIPFDEPSVLVIHPTDDTTARWQITGGGVLHGWEGGVLLADGIVIGIPRNAARFLRIDPSTGTAAPFGDDLSDAVDGGREKFRGGVVGLNGQVYAAPAGSSYVARLDPASGAVTKLRIPAPFLAGRTHGAVLFPTGDIVMFPSADSPGLLIIPSRDDGPDQVWLLPTAHPAGPTRFSGCGAITGESTAVSAPQQSNRTLGYDEGFLSWGAPVTGIPEQVASAFFFGAWSTDGNIYVLPYSQPSALRMNVRGEAGLVPLNISAPIFSAVSGAVGRPDGRIIGIPFTASSWLELTPSGRRTVPAEAMTSPYLNKL